MNTRSVIAMNKLRVSVIRNEIPIYATLGANKLVIETA